MTSFSIKDFRWLLSQEGRQWSQSLVDDAGDESLVQSTNRLRKQLSATRTHLLLELHELRQRAADKFENAPRLFFTRLGLQQATDQWIAQYKSERFPQAERVADLCCGIGGDLMGLADRTSVTGVDRDPVLAIVAQANLKALGLSGQVIHGDATTLSLGEFAAWHIDPDRRPLGNRTTRPEFFEPDTTALEQLLAQSPNAAIKTAPATQIPERWQALAERQWIGSGRECKQQIFWFGQLADHPGFHSAVVVHHRQGTSDLLVGSPNDPVKSARNVEPFVFEPHATVLAAKLVGCLASRYEMQAIDPNVPYLTAGKPLHDPLVSCFETMEVLPFDRRRLKSALRHHKVGQLEVKIRGVPGDPAVIKRKVQGRGEVAGCVIITPLGGSAHAIVCRRH